MAPFPNDMLTILRILISVFWINNLLKVKMKKVLFFTLLLMFFRVKVLKDYNVDVGHYVNLSPSTRRCPVTIGLKFKLHISTNVVYSYILTPFITVFKLLFVSLIECILHSVRNHRFPLFRCNLLICNDNSFFTWTLSQVMLWMYKVSCIEFPG